MKKIIAASIALLPSIAFAHPGHTENFVSAFAHPFTGIDHLLMMLCVGIFAGQIGGNARWQLPLAFLSAMTCGWLLAAMGYSFAGIDSGIAAGLIMLGVLFIWRLALPVSVQILSIAMFAILHGMAHGAELSSTTPIATSVGFLIATAVLHVAGLAINHSLVNKENVRRAIGALLAIIGGSLLLTA